MHAATLPLLVVFIFAAFVSSSAMATPGAGALVATPANDTPCPAFEPATPSPTPAPTAEPPLGVGPTPTPAPDPEAVVDPLLEEMAAAAAAHLEACWNAGHWQAVAQIVTPRFLETAFGIAAADERQRVQALAGLDLGPLRIETIGPVGLWGDGRGAVDVLYVRGHGAPVQAVAARWFFVAARGVAHFDEETLLTPPPLGARVTIGFSIADDVQPLQWASLAGGQIPASPAIALHGANRGRATHTFILQDITGETLGLMTLPPWIQGDLLMLDLPPGVYRLRDPAVAGSVLELVVD